MYICTDLQQLDLGAHQEHDVRIEHHGQLLADEELVVEPRDAVLQHERKQQLRVSAGVQESERLYDTLVAMYELYVVAALPRR